MNPSELISVDRISSTTSSLARDPYFIDRLAWWLRGAHSSEHWFQFEWAYHLQSTVPPGWSVECEVERVDVVVRPESTSDSPSVGVEIKWYGNWWMDDLPGVQLDIEKINEKQYPSAAILFFLKVSPSNSARELAWMSEQIPRQGTNQDLADLVHEHIKRSLDHRGSLALPSHQAFDRASLQYAVWYNDAYRR